MGWKRARTEEQVAQRRAEIVSAAASLLGEHELADVSLNGIAREAGLAKSNLYRYFASREDIFLAILGEDVSAWADRQEQLLGALPADPSAEQVADALVDGLIASPRLVRLLGQLLSVIERSSSVEAITEFKLHIHECGARVTAALVAAVPWMDAEQAKTLLGLQVHLVQGLWPTHRMPPAVVEALKHPKLQGMQIPFELALRRATVLMVKGLKSEEL